MQPDLIIAADWSAKPEKRWMSRARLGSDGRYTLDAPEPVGDETTLIDRLSRQVGRDGRVLLCFDFPIGLPAAYAERVGIERFRDALGQFGAGHWSHFYDVSSRPTLTQPFYPPPSQKKGEFDRAGLLSGLGLGEWEQLLRRCDRVSKAGALFFTLGGKQVGRAAISGWRDVIAPSLDRVRIWPFDGPLAELLQAPGVVIAEIYPGAAYSQLGFVMGRNGRSKTRRPDRRAVADCLLAEGHERITVSDAARSWIEWGFLGEDDFDAFVSTLLTVKVVLGEFPSASPEDPAVTGIEGWILGLV